MDNETTTRGTEMRKIIWKDDEYGGGCGASVLRGSLQLRINYRVHHNPNLVDPYPYSAYIGKRKVVAAKTREAAIIFANEKFEELLKEFLEV